MKFFKKPVVVDSVVMSVAVVIGLILVVGFIVVVVDVIGLVVVGVLIVVVVVETIKVKLLQLPISLRYFPTNLEENDPVKHHCLLNRQELL